MTETGPASHEAGLLSLWPSSRHCHQARSGLGSLPYRAPARITPRFLTTQHIITASVSEPDLRVCALFTLLGYRLSDRLGRSFAARTPANLTLRQSFGKHALDAGADLVSVSAHLEHQRLETTAIYATPSQRDLERVVEKLEQDGSLR